MPDEAGTLLAGIGIGRAADASFPLTGLEGDLVRLPVSLSYSFAPGAVFYVRGDAYRRMEVERRAPTDVDLDPGVDDGVTADAGDVRVGTLFRIVGGADGLSGGLHLDVTIPSSDERKGIGTNSTDVAVSAFGSWGRGPWRASADVGVGILEAPVDRFVQNDLLVYAAELTWHRPGTPWRLGVETAGRAGTRGVIPIGTQDRGRVTGRAEWLDGAWRVDGGVAVGYGESGSAWSLEVGLARLFRL